MREVLAKHGFDTIDQRVESGFLGAPLQPAKADPAEVLDPFEIADRHTAGIGIEIGNDHNAAFAEDRVSFRRDGAVGGLDDQRCLDIRGVVRGDHEFHRRRDQNVGIGLQHLHAASHLAGKARDAAIFHDV